LELGYTQSTNPEVRKPLNGLAVNDSGTYDAIPTSDRSGCRLTAMLKRSAVAASRFSFPRQFRPPRATGVEVPSFAELRKRARIPAPDHRTQALNVVRAACPGHRAGCIMGPRQRAIAVSLVRLLSIHGEAQSKKATRAMQHHLKRKVT
jgi:hypothetical protein